MLDEEALDEKNAFKRRMTAESVNERKILHNVYSTERK